MSVSVSSPTVATPRGSVSAAAGRRRSMREDMAMEQHAARLNRSSSAGSIRSSASASSAPSAPAKTRPPEKAKYWEHRSSTAHRSSVERTDKPFAWLERPSSAGTIRAGQSPRAERPSSAGTVRIESPRKSLAVESPTKAASDAVSALGQSPSGKVIVGRELYQQVSTLVEELEAARSRAVASGSRPPRAIEAASSALEPLLRLRDATGSFSCDLTLMPWLPQLLAVFRNVLHTAVDGPGAPPRTPPACDTNLTSPDSGAGCTSNPFAAAVAAASMMSGDCTPRGAARHAALAGLAGLTGVSDTIELEELRKRSQQQDKALHDYQLREKKMQEEMKELKRERAEMMQQARFAEAKAASLEAQLKETGGNSSARRRTWAGGNIDWQTEKISVEERLLQLVDLVSAAVEEPDSGSAFHRRSRTPSVNGCSVSPRRTPRAYLSYGESD